MNLKMKKPKKGFGLDKRENPVLDKGT